MTSTVLILSAQDVAQLTQDIPADAICRMIGKTMHAISADSKHPHDPSSATAPPIQNPLRIATESEQHKTLYMPSRLTTAPGESATAIKVVAVPKPSCTIPGLPATTLLFDESTGLCRAVVNAAELTGLRTAAASALSAQLLAEPCSRFLVILGTGTQAYYHARLILQLFPTVQTATFIVRKINERATSLVERVQNEFKGVEVRAATAEETQALVKEADIICGCVPSTEPVFAVEDLKPNVHITAIGSYQPTMREFPPSLISPSTPTTSPSSPYIPTILVDSRSACLSEAGELISAKIPASSCVELGEVVSADGVGLEGKEGAVGRGLRSSGRSLFKCVGVGGMDVAVTELVVRSAEQKEVGLKAPF